MNDHKEIPGIEAWLGTRKADEVLSKVARSVMKEMFSKGLSAAFLSRETDSNAPSEDLLQEIKSELVLFILENQSRLRSFVSLEAWGSHQLLKHAFINHWKTQTRRPDRDVQRYLYKRVSDLLRKSEAFHTTGGQRAAFSMAPKSTPIPSLCTEDMAQIIFPDRIVEVWHFDFVNKKAVLLDLAANFWKQVSALWGNGPVLVYLRDFIDWIGLHVPIKTKRPLRDLPNGSSFADQEANVQSNPAEAYLDHELVKRWAGSFANRLGEKEKPVFYLHHGLGLRLKDIAERLNYKGSSGPKYVLDQAEQKLRFFLRDLPWLSPDDLNEEAFSLFFEKVLSVLKKVVPEP